MQLGKILMSFGAVLTLAAGCSVQPIDDVARGQDKLTPDPGDDCGQCTEEWDPVCGTDGNTYSNACFAEHAGVDILHDGECDNGGGECGGELDNICAPGSYCKSEDGVCGGRGTCTPIGDLLCVEIYDPVCGCDGQTYDNACFAEGAGVDVASEGECAPKEKICGGFAGLECADDAYCHYEGGTCGEYDLQGICEPLPQACTDEWAPVCGCDGMTHGNACEAAAAGTSVRYEGECKADSAG